MICEPIEGWFVWTRTGRRPHVKHPDYDTAAKEAQRLARKHPGTKFIVLLMTDKFHEPAEPLSEPVVADPLRELADG